MVRKALHPEYYKPHHPGPSPGDQDEILGTDHIDHCIDVIDVQRRYQCIDLDLEQEETAEYGGWHNSSHMQKV